MGLEDVDYACSMIRSECSDDANIIFGVGFDQNLEDEMRITIIATGFEKKPEDAADKSAEVKAEAEAVVENKTEVDDWLSDMFK